MNKLSDLFDFAVSGDIWMVNEAWFDDPNADGVWSYIGSQEWFEDETDEEKADIIAYNINDNPEHHSHDWLKSACQRHGVAIPSWHC